ncbi:MAG: hypothetical protein K0R65_107 [Crocinitomicaceae bacterium]|jgi:hypothetical protein|nr:hypothetical protein [Crocinitomicaceae bacterium]
MKKKYSFIYRNGLSLAFLLLMLCSLAGQIYSGWLEHNDFLAEYGKTPQALSEYMYSGHFLQATFENWESEFFQMALFVILTIFLKQEGSSESGKCGEETFDPAELKAKKNSPWSVKKGGFFLGFYKHSLSIVLFLLFILSFVLHWYGSWLDFNEKEFLEGRQGTVFADYLSNKKFWFESFQNWQSEFLSILAIIFLSIYLRQFGSSQSKPVNAPHDHTGE